MGTMTVSRCCVPACCPSCMEAGPKPCPPTCFTCLDCPFIGLTFLMLTFGLLELIVFELVSAADPISLRLLRGIRLLQPVLAITALVTAIVKACQMSDAKPESMQEPDGGVIVGVPVNAQVPEKAP